MTSSVEINKPPESSLKASFKLGGEEEEQNNCEKLNLSENKLNNSCEAKRSSQVDIELDNKDRPNELNNKPSILKRVFSCLYQKLIIRSCFLVNNVKASRILLFFVLSAISWLVLFLVFRSSALPGGICFSLYVLIIASHILGYLLELVKMPSLLGMLITGIIFRNVPVINIVGNSIDSQTSSMLRSVSFCVILCRAGLNLNIQTLVKMKYKILKFSFIPCVVESLVFSGACTLILNMPFIWSLLLGFVISGVSPAVVVPMMIELQERSGGKLKELQTLVIAASCIDNLVSITLFSLLASIMFNQSDLAWTIAQCPVEIIAGIGYGIFVGFFLNIIRQNNVLKLSSIRFATVFMFSVVALLGAKKLGISSAGPISVLILTVISRKIWSDVDKNIIESKELKVDDNVTAESYINKNETETNELFSKIWFILFLPLLFALIGSEIDFKKINLSVIGLGLAALCIALLFRAAATFFAVSFNEFSLKEKIFLVLLWIPKATVQAAVGSVALDYAKENNNDYQIDQATKILNIAVLSIIVTAPIGTLLIALTAPRLLNIK